MQPHRVSSNSGLRRNHHRNACKMVGLRGFTFGRGQNKDGTGLRVVCQIRRIYHLCEGASAYKKVAADVSAAAAAAVVAIEIARAS